MNEVTNNIPGVSNLTSLVEKQEVQGFLEGLIGEYGWLLLIAIATILAKDMIMNLVQGVLVFMGNDFNNDDIIYISGRQARIVRVGIRNTVFYMSDRSSKMLVPNEQLKQLTIEKTLPKNGGAPYLPKGSDPGFIGVKEVPVEPHPMQVEVVNKPPSPKNTKK
jgi:hypothetical protein